MADAKLEFPFKKWDRVGWRGHLAEVRNIDESRREAYIYFLTRRHTYPKWVSIEELTDPPPFPGQPVGWKQLPNVRCTITRVTEDRQYVSLRWTVDGRTQATNYVPVGELTDAPPVADHVQQAAQEAVSAGVFSDVRRAVFGEDA